MARMAGELFSAHEIFFCCIQKCHSVHPVGLNLVSCSSIGNVAHLCDALSLGGPGPRKFFRCQKLLVSLSRPFHFSYVFCAKRCKQKFTSNIGHFFFFLEQKLLFGHAQQVLLPVLFLTCHNAFLLGIALQRLFVAVQCLVILLQSQVRPSLVHVSFHAVLIHLEHYA